MRVRVKRRLLILFAIGSMGLAIASVYWSFTEAGLIAAPDLLPSPAASENTASPTASEQSPLSKDAFAELWHRPLRRPLYDPPPPPAPVVEKPPPRPVTARLLATMIEPAGSVAMLQLQSGEVVFRKQGDSISADDQDAVIEEIHAGAVEVRRGDHLTKLMIEGNH